MTKPSVNYNDLFSDWNTNFLHNLFADVEHRQAIKELKLEFSDRVLDVGCNSGNLVRKLLASCRDAVGVDINREAIEKSGLGNLLFMSAESLDFEDESFDKIVSIHTIEHIPDIKKALNEMGRVVKDGGRVVLAFPMEPIRGFAALPSACIVYKNPFMCRKLHLHKLNPKKIKLMLGKTGLKMVSHRVIFNPLPVYLVVLEKNSAS